MMLNPKLRCTELIFTNYGPFPYVFFIFTFLARIFRYVPDFRNCTMSQ